MPYQVMSMYVHRPGLSSVSHSLSFFSPVSAPEQSAVRSGHVMSVSAREGGGGGCEAHVGMGVVLCYLILAGCLGAERAVQREMRNQITS